MGLAVALGPKHSCGRFLGDQPTPQLDQQFAGAAGQVGRQAVIVCGVTLSAHGF